MISRLLGLLIVLHLIDSFEQQGTAFGQSKYPRLKRVYYNGTYNVSNQEDSRIYLFPPDLRPHALNASVGLLLAQKKHLENLTKQFEIIDRKTNIQELKKMDAVIFSIEIIIDTELKSLKSKFEIMEKLTSEEKVDPIKEVSIVCMLSAWTHMLTLIDRMKIEEKMAGIKEQVGEMKRTIDTAAVELRLYERIQEDRLERINKTRTTVGLEDF